MLRALCCALFLAATPVTAMPPVDVQGLFGGRVVVLIDGQREVMSEGETVAGITLIAADSQRAVFEYDGQRFESGLSSRVGGSYAAPARQEVRIARDGRGMFRSAGRINGRPVTFLVDTGATAIALNSQLAQTLGVDYQRLGTPVPVTTASGRTTGYRLTLNEVSVGTIRLSRVAAIVLEGGYPYEPLLGMSFLGRIEMRNSGQMMVLEALE